MKHTLAIEVRNHPGVMAHVSGLFSRRGYNIDSIAVGMTVDPKISIITIVVDGDDRVLDQVARQCVKLADVIRVRDLPYAESITRELALITVRASTGQRPELMGITDVFGGKVVDLTDETVSIEVSGNSRQVKAILKLLEPFGIEDLARTGQIALPYRSPL